MSPISPGVYTNITPLSSYVQEVPSSVGFIPFFSNKGPDNKIRRITSLSELIRLYGEPDYIKYGYTFGGGHLVAYSFIQTSPNCFVMRLLPDDATHSNMHCFDVFERPFVLKAKTGTVNLSINNTTGILSVAFNVPNIGNTLYKFVHINTSDEAVKLVLREDGLMSVYVSGTRNSADATIALSDGIIAITQDNKINITGHGNLTVTNSNGSIYVLTDDITIFPVWTPFNMVEDIDEVINYLKLRYRPSYVVNSALFTVGDKTGALYKVKLRKPMAQEKYLEKAQLCVPNDINNPTVWYVVTVTYTTIPVVNVTEIPSNGFDVIEARHYQRIIENKVYGLVYDESSEELYWKEVTLVNPENAVFDAIYPAFTIKAKYRGNAYNNYMIDVDQVINRDDVFNFSIYEKKNDYNVVIGSYQISFDKNMVDSYGQSIFAEEVINKYTDLTIKCHEFNCDLLPKLQRMGRFILVNQVINDTKEITEPGWYYIRTNSTIRNNNFRVNYGENLGKFILLRGDGNSYNNSLVKSVQLSDMVFGDISSKKHHFITVNNTVATFNIENHIILRTNNFSFYLAGGSDGSLFGVDNKINSVVATNLLVNAYLGNIDNDVVNTEMILFDLVFDGGYPKDVKDAITVLVHELRKDCVAIIDNGDNVSSTEALNNRIKNHNYNSEYVSIYEPYIKIYDDFSGRDIWITPVYAIARLIGLNDRINEVWYAVSGVSRGSTPVIKELRYSPPVTDRDLFYIHQINPIVNFREGLILWGQLTSIKTPNALQNLNIMRLLMYCKRALERYCRYFIFELNDAITWESIRKSVRNFLSDVKRRRGLYDFSVEVYADEYALLRKMANVDVILFPTRALERINLNFFVK